MSRSGAVLLAALFAGCATVPELHLIPEGTVGRAGLDRAESYLRELGFVVQQQVLSTRSGRVPNEIALVASREREEGTTRLRVRYDVRVTWRAGDTTYAADGRPAEPWRAVVTPDRTDIHVRCYEWAPEGRWRAVDPAHLRSLAEALTHELAGSGEPRTAR